MSRPREHADGYTTKTSVCSCQQWEDWLMSITDTNMCQSVISAPDEATAQFMRATCCSSGNSGNAVSTDAAPSPSVVHGRYRPRIFFIKAGIL